MQERRDTPITLALSIANEAHLGQTYGNRGLPYIYHPMAVACAAVAHGYPEHMVVAALLHDVIEDTEVTYIELLDAGISEEAVALVELLTRKEERSGSTFKEESYTDFVTRIAANPEAARIKLLDIEHNMSTLDTIPDPDVNKRARLHKKYTKARLFLSGYLDLNGGR